MGVAAVVLVFDSHELDRNDAQVVVAAVVEIRSRNRNFRSNNLSIAVVADTDIDNVVVDVAAACTRDHRGEAPADGVVDAAAVGAAPLQHISGHSPVEAVRRTCQRLLIISSLLSLVVRLSHPNARD